MSIKKNKYSICVVYRPYTNRYGEKKLKIVGYLSNRDEEQGLDAHLDMQGYTVEAL